MSVSMDKLAQVKLTELVVNPKDDIVDGPFGSRLKASEYVDAGVPIVRLQNIDRNQFVDKNIKFVTKAKANEIARHHFVSGDILISKLGDPLGEACIAPEQFPYGILVADVVRVRPDKRKVDTSFLAYALNSAPVVQQFKAETKGTTRPRVNLKKIRDLRVPITESLAQQRQIVAEIEKQFTRLDAGVAALRRVQANLKRYRAAVLKAACEGRLVPTEAELDRAEGRTCETSEQLLARILADRRKNWHGRGKYKEPAAPEPAMGAALPNGWAWTGFEQLADGTKNAIKAGPFGSALKKSSYAPTGYKIYGQEQVIRGDPYYGDYFIPSDLFERLRSCEVKAGDILISLVGTAGKVLVLPKDCASGIINPRLLKLSLHVSGVNPKFIKILLESTTTRTFFKLAAHGGTMEILNLGILKSLPIALPPLAEQTRIVAEVERRLSVIDELEAAVTANLQRGARLRQSVLQRAFAGRGP